MKKLLLALLVGTQVAGCATAGYMAIVTIEEMGRRKDARERRNMLKPDYNLKLIREAKNSGATKLILRDRGDFTKLAKPLAGLTNLEVLFLDENNVTDLSPLAGLTNLQELYLQYNNVTDLSPLMGLTNLEVLFLYDNKITDVSPLKGLMLLRMLRLTDNEITDLTPLAGLTNLQKLHLAQNKITDLTPLKGLTNLVELNLYGNFISDDQKEMLKKALPDCKISF